jgi:hypothetical protein
MAIKDWEDDWRIPVIISNIPVGAEEEEARKEHTNVEGVGQGETQCQEVPVPKKPRTSQTKPKQTKGGSSKIGTHKGKPNNTQVPQVPQKQAKIVQGTTPSLNPQEIGLTKIPSTQTGGARKKMKVHRTPPEYTFTKDDVEMMQK